MELLNADGGDDREQGYSAGAVSIIVVHDSAADSQRDAAVFQGLRKKVQRWRRVGIDESRLGTYLSLSCRCVGIVRVILRLGTRSPQDQHRNYHRSKARFHHEPPVKAQQWCPPAAVRRFAVDSSLRLLP